MLLFYEFGKGNRTSLYSGIEHHWALRQPCEFFFGELVLQFEFTFMKSMAALRPDNSGSPFTKFFPNPVMPLRWCREKPKHFSDRNIHKKRRRKASFFCYFCQNSRNCQVASYSIHLIFNYLDWYRWKWKPYFINLRLTTLLSHSDLISCFIN